MFAEVAGSWTPGLTAATVGDLAVAFSTQAGAFHRQGRKVTVDFALVTSSFTYTTATGAIIVTGLPFPVNVIGLTRNEGTFEFGGLTKAGFTQFTTRPVVNTTTCQFQAAGTALATVNLAITDFPTAGSVVIRGSATYLFI